MAQAASPARAWIGTIVFLFLAPGVVAGLIPRIITGWRLYDWGGAAWVVARPGASENLTRPAFEVRA